MTHEQLTSGTTLTVFDDRSAHSLHDRLRPVIAPARMLPTCLILGAQKAGTTTLHHHLLEHPAIGGCRYKGVHYFDLASERGLSWYRSHFPWRGRYAHAIESSPYYLFHPAVPRRVREQLPEAKLIVLLRDPLRRAHSQWNHARAWGLEPLGFAEAIAAEEERLAGEEERLLASPRAVSMSHRHHSYVSRSLYAPQIARWYAHFPSEQLLLLRSEDLFTDPQGTLARVYGWLGVDPHRPAAPHSTQLRQATHDETSPEVADALRPRFEADRAELERLTGIDFDWGSAGSTRPSQAQNRSAA